MRVLLVDDNRDVREMLCNGLSEMGHECTSVSTLAQGRAELAASRYDAVVADSGLPDGNGLDLAVEAEAKQIRSVVITGQPIAMRMLERRKIAHLRKPFSLSELDSAINGHFWA